VACSLIGKAKRPNQFFHGQPICSPQGVRRWILPEQRIADWHNSFRTSLFQQHFGNQSPKNISIASPGKRSEVLPPPGKQPAAQPLGVGPSTT
jgi:hypothetical protein